MLGYENRDGVLWDSLWFYAAFGRSFVCCSESCSDWLHACCLLGLSFSLEFSAVLGFSLQLIYRHSLPSRLPNLPWFGHTCTCYRVPLFREHPCSHLASLLPPPHPNWEFLCNLVGDSREEMGFYLDNGEWVWFQRKGCGRVTGKDFLHKEMKTARV